MNFTSSHNHLRLLSGGLLLSSFLVWGSAAKADISISPIVVETQSKRGQAQGLIKVSNLNEKQFRARVYTSPFTYDKVKGFQVLTNSPNDLTPYMQFSPRELQVNGSSERNIRFVVRFPPSLPDGEYRTMIFTENLETSTVTEEDKPKGVVMNTTIIPRIGVAVYVRKGNISPNIAATSARFEAATKNIELLVKNSGKATAVLAGNWKLKQGNKVIQAGEVNDTTVIAQGERNFLLKPSDANKTALVPGEYELSGELGWGENRKNRIPFRVPFTVPNR
ncbi:MAG: hypothetical protein KME64_30740 [Scytonematopsis contorta HA4267-MV1]|jgi:hypothetical protein|nr:hypothetical protein [Scytonematopsis contorta HA4267-MV1]